MPSHFGQVLPFFSSSWMKSKWLDFFKCQYSVNGPFPGKNRYNTLIQLFAVSAEARLWEATQAATTRSSAFTGLEHVEDAKSYRVDDQSNLMSPVRLMAKRPFYKSRPRFLFHPKWCAAWLSEHKLKAFIDASTELNSYNTYILGNLTSTYMERENADC